MQAQQQQQQLLRPFAPSTGNRPQNFEDAFIVSDGYFVRMASGANQFGFQYDTSGQIVAVEPYPLQGQDRRRHHNDTALYIMYPWFLNLKSFLWLRPKNAGPLTHTRAIRNYILDNSFSIYRGNAYREYGMHVFVGTDNFLHAMNIFRETRRGPVMPSEIYNIGDIVPKARVFRRSGTNPSQYDYCVIKSVFIKADRNIDITRDMFARWWYRFGREEMTRFVECDKFDSMWDKYMKNARQYFGLYVHDRAKLVITDEVVDLSAAGRRSGDPPPHNRTLILGGVFVIVNGFINYVMANHIFINTYRLNTAKFIRLYNKYNGGQRITQRNIEHPVIMLCPVPSNGESLCWGLSIEEPYNNVMMARFVIPSFGMCRLAMYEWDDGLAQVRREQRYHLYHQNVRIAGVSPRIPNTEVRVTHLHANDQLDLMDVNVEDPTI